MAWIQGEADAKPYVRGHMADLKTMLRQLRKELDAPDLIVVLTVNPHFERQESSVETIA